MIRISQWSESHCRTNNTGYASPLLRLQEGGGGDANISEKSLLGGIYFRDFSKTHLLSSEKISFSMFQWRYVVSVWKALLFL